MKFIYELKLDLVVVYLISFSYNRIAFNMSTWCNVDLVYKMLVRQVWLKNIPSSIRTDGT
jgi:hypothetical protein